MTNTVYFSIGSNLGDRYGNLRRAVDQLQQHMTITAVSPVYSTAPWGDSDQPEFLNACVGAVTDLTPEQLLEQVKRIETEMGREPARHWGPRLIDIDILYFNKLLLDQEDLSIPHRYIAERAFVLAPLADIIPGFVDPRTLKTVEMMLDEVDTTGVDRVFEMPFPGGRVTTPVFEGGLLS